MSNHKKQQIDSLSEYRMKQGDYLFHYRNEFTEAYNQIDSMILVIISYLHKSTDDSNYITEYAIKHRSEERLSNLIEYLKDFDTESYEIMLGIKKNYKTLIKYRTHLTHKSTSYRFIDKRVNLNQIFLVSLDTMKEVCIPLRNLDVCLDEYGYNFFDIQKVQSLVCSKILTKTYTDDGTH